ncbi:UNVERIFIED_ORG: hypothetical protein J2Y84_003759 [Pseudomonas reinekei]|nr:hypothetical protein [Pseudomonas reinekei]
MLKNSPEKSWVEADGCQRTGAARLTDFPSTEYCSVTEHYSVKEEYSANRHPQEAKK